MNRCFFALTTLLLPSLVLLLSSPVAAKYEAPANYYSTATGTGSTLQNQLRNIIDNHTSISYNQARTALQDTDVDPNDPDSILLVYDRVSLDLSNIGGSIPGWDSGNSWNREHTWPRSRGVGSGGPDNSDLHQLRPSTPSVNSDRGSLNFGGEFGQSFGLVQDGGEKFYPGDADAGMIARQMFYMETRYDYLQLADGNPSSSALGDLDRLVEWHYEVAPDEFEQRRNHVIYEDYQGNRNPYVDHPEYVWSVFVNQNNDSQISLVGATPEADGSSALTLDLGRAYIGSPMPATQTVEVQKSGSAGTYFQVSDLGGVSSSFTAAKHPFATGTPAAVEIDIALTGDTNTAGTLSGALAIDNLDITTGGGAGVGASDANDWVSLEFEVLNHPVASFSESFDVGSLVIDFGEATQNEVVGSLPAVIANYNAEGAPLFASHLDLDSITGSGDTDILSIDLELFAGLTQGGIANFDATLNTSVAGSYEATFDLLLSGEDLPGEQTQILSLTLLAEVLPGGMPGDFNDDGLVNTLDYATWRDNLGSDFDLNANGVSDGVVDALDYEVWKSSFGDAMGSTVEAQPVPEPKALLILLVALSMPVTGARLRRRPACPSLP